MDQAVDKAQEDIENIQNNIESIQEDIEEAKLAPKHVFLR